MLRWVTGVTGTAVYKYVTLYQTNVNTSEDIAEYMHVIMH